MARIEPISYRMCYTVKFATVIRGYHVYKKVWTPALGEEVSISKDDRPEAKLHDENAMGVYKCELLCGHVPRELSELLRIYVAYSSTNNVTAKVTGECRAEHGLVVPALFEATTENRFAAEQLHERLENKLHERLENINNELPSFSLKIFPFTKCKLPTINFKF